MKIDMNLETVGTVISAIGTIVGLGIFKKIWSLYKKNKNSREEHRDHVNKTLETIRQQLYPNGGASLFDHVLSLKFGQRNSWELQHLAVWESDREGQITFVTPTLCEMVGCQREDLMHNSWKYLVSDDEADSIFKKWKNSVEAASQFNEQYHFKLKNKPGWLQKVEAEAIHNKDNRGIVISSMGRFKKIGEPYQK